MTLMFDRAPLKRRERELIGVAVSRTNGCPYCVAHHADALARYEIDAAGLGPRWALRPLSLRRGLGYIMVMDDDVPAAKSDIRTLDAKIDGVGQRLDVKIEGAEKRLDAKIDGVEKRLDTKIDGVEKRLDAKIDDVRRELKGDIFKTHAKMDRMEERLTGLIRGESEKTISRIDAFLGKLETFERESHTLPKTLDQHGKRLADHETRIAAIESGRHP